MSRDDVGELGNLAGAILDGAAVDWDAADARAAPRDKPLVRHLRAIAAIVRAHHLDGPETWGTLKLLERIGRGAFGDVYRAWDPRLDREVALKLLPADPFSPVLTIEEGRLLARVRHPNVVTIYGAERLDDRVGLWMEYIDGRTLHQLVVDDARRFTAKEVGAIGCSICDAVAAVHAAGLLHLDIKAQNVMMGRDGRVVLMDFGAGCQRNRRTSSEFAGTPLYVAPELLSGTSNPSIRSDIYSIGVLLFFLLTGSYPVTGVDVASLRRAHETGDRRSLKELAPAIPQRLLDAVERAIEPRPERRFDNAAGLGAELPSLIRRARRVRPDLDPSHDNTVSDAHELCRRGRALIDRRGMANAQQAVELFERAIALDREFAPAHAGQASAYAFWSFPYRGVSFSTALPVMRPAAAKALELDPLLGAGHAAMGWVHAYARDWVHAEEAFNEAIRLAPTLTQAYTSYSLSTLQPLQRYDEALRLLQAARDQDPSSLDVQREIGEVQMLCGRYVEAIETFRGVIEVEPDYPFVQSYLAKGLMRTGNVADAIPRLEPGFPWLAQAYVMSGRRAEAERLAVEWEAYPFRLSIIAAALDDADRAAEALERAAVSEPHRMGWLLVQPEMAAIRDHPRTVALRKGLSLP